MPPWLLDSQETERRVEPLTLPKHPCFAAPANPARHGVAAAARLALKENDPAECIPHQPATQSRFALAFRSLAHQLIFQAAKPPRLPLLGKAGRN